VIERSTGHVVGRVPPAGDLLPGAEFSPDGSLIAGIDRTSVSVSDVTGLRAPRRAETGESRLNGLWSPDGERLLLYRTGTAADRFQVWSKDLKRCEVRANRDHGPGADFTGIVVWAGATRFLTSNGDGGVTVWVLRRPPVWWGVAWLWEFWLATAIAACAATLLIRDVRASSRGAPSN
jgi:hypothetical protein